MIRVAVVAESRPESVRETLVRLAETSQATPGRLLAEVRLDFLSTFDAGVFADPPLPIIATCRRPRDGGKFRGPETARFEMLRAAAAAGAAYVDVESDVIESAGSFGAAKIVASHHDFEIVPSDLDALATRLRAGPGVAMVKIAARLRTLTDIVAVAMTLRRHRGMLTFVGTGPTGLVTRVLASKLGSAWTYATAGSSEAPVGGTSVFDGIPSLEDLMRFYAPGPDTPPSATYAVVGSSAYESIGPIAWNRFFRTAGVPASYVSLTTPALVGLREAASMLGIRGFSVTTPFKAAALEAVDEVSPRARMIGAANTLVHEHGKWVAYNTDADGIAAPTRAMLATIGRDPRDVRALVVGAGGAGRAAVFGLRSLGIDVTLAARDGWKAAPVAETFGIPCLGPRAIPDAGFDLVVNATPAGSTRDPDGDAVSLAWLRPGAIVFETNYAPRETRLTASARNAGMHVIPGEAMYEAQGLAQLHHFWAGLTPASSELWHEAVSWAFSRAT